MAILTHDVILDYIDKKVIRINPFDPARVGPASIDLTLDKTFRVFKNLHEPLQLDSDSFNPDIFSEVITVEKSITLQSGQTILGITVEKLTLPSTLCGWIQGRSRFARIGLMVHISSSFIQPGVDNKQVLEMFNAGPMPITIFPGISICQIVLEETLGSASYHGKFQHQVNP
jgi:dCTP deaminase